MTELGLRKVNVEGVSEFLWPVEDFNAFHWPLQDWINDKKYFLEHVKNRSVVIQAGGCCGMYPRFYANYFKQVYTFEPDHTNYVCLTNNVSDVDNVIHYNFALGSSNKFVSLDAPSVVGEETNRGMFTVNETEGSVQMITLDSLNVSGCDLIHYDLEGYETQALIGSIETINRFNPVIIVERLSGKEFLESIGYRLVKKTSMDSIFVR